MQWLIDLILESLQGMIVVWSGAIVDIPSGWALCDGAQGTPNLRDKFIMGASPENPVGTSGGNVNHNHNFTGDGHNHFLPAGTGTAPGAIQSIITTTDPAVGTTDNADGRPPFYALAYIMKL